MYVIWFPRPLHKRESSLPSTPFLVISLEGFGHHVLRILEQPFRKRSHQKPALGCQPFEWGTCKKICCPTDLQGSISLPGILICLCPSSDVCPCQHGFMHVHRKLGMAFEEERLLFSVLFKTRLVLYVYKVKVVWFLVSMGRLIVNSTKWVKNVNLT